MIVVRHAEAAPGEPGRGPAADRAGPRGGAPARRAPRGAEARRGRLEPAPPCPGDGRGDRRGGRVEAAVDDHLVPGADADDLRAAVAGRGETVVAVGHQPDCSEIVLALTGRSVQFPTAGFAEIVEPLLRPRLPCLPMRNGGAAIRVSGLRKSYGSHEALRGIDFEIGAGEVFGLLGPNGAGKTTTIEILEGYRDRDGGEVEVLGQRSRPGAQGVARAGRGRPPVLVALPEPDGAREPRGLRRLLREPTRCGGDHRDRRADRQDGRPLPHALGRAEAAARSGARARRQPRASLPRRADHGVRSRRAPGGVGDDPQPALARHDDPPDHALPRRGGAALGPGRGASRGPDRAASGRRPSSPAAPPRPRSGIARTER